MPSETKEEFRIFLSKQSTSSSNKASSYVRALDLLGPILINKAPSKFHVADIWAVNSLDEIRKLYEYVLQQQRLGDQGVFAGEAPVAYWRDRFMSAALKSYGEFLAINRRHELQELPSGGAEVNSIVCEIFKQALTATSCTFTSALTERFIASLGAKPFVILTGNSGTGKTKLAQLFAQWLDSGGGGGGLFSIEVTPEVIGQKRLHLAPDKVEKLPRRSPVRGKHPWGMATFPGDSKSTRQYYIEENADGSADIVAELGGDKAGSQFFAVLGNYINREMLVSVSRNAPGSAIWYLSFTPIEQAGARYALVPVGADWTDNRNVLGFVNHLKRDEATTLPVFQSTPALDLVLRASQDQTHPYFLILDEMNLSHVERYFSDFLSVMESREEILIHSEGCELSTASGCLVPARLRIPHNLFVVGTVNVDETTYMFSPKVLDRANVIEFRVEADDLRKFFTSSSGAVSSEIEVAPAGMAEAFLDLSLRARGLGNGEPLAEPPDIERIQQLLLDFFQILQKAGFEFAYRTANEVMRYVRVSYALKPPADMWDWEQVMDCQILQRLLPKLHGSRRRIEKTLIALARLCEKGADITGILSDLKDDKVLDDKENVGNARFRLSYEKLWAMINTVRRDQFVSFIQ